MPSHLPHVGVALKFCLALMFFLGIFSHPTIWYVLGFPRKSFVLAMKITGTNGTNGTNVPAHPGV